MKAQDEDDHINALKKILAKEPYQDYILQKDILYKEKDGYRLIVVPKKMQFEIIGKNHEREHFGIAKTKELLKEKETVQHFNKKRLELREKAKESIKKIQEENLRNYNKKRKEAIVYDVGDLVAIKNTQFSQGSKLFPNFLGPYEITAKKRNDRYTVKKVSNGEGPINTSTSADLMKPWTMPEEDESSSEADE